MDTNTDQPIQSYQPPQTSDDQMTQSADPSNSSVPPSDSYADAYVPPQDPGQNPAQVNDPAPDQFADDSSAPSYQPERPEMPDMSPQMPEPALADAPTDAPAPSQDLADQNIFEMLGVTTGTPEQREQFLDELQQVIWEDFIEHDTKLLLTDAEQAELQTIMQSSVDKSMEQQEKVVVFLEKLIPDLEDIMLEKALQLKEEMARERLKALRELHRNNTENMAKIDQAEQAMGQDQWRTATETLNSL